MNTSSLDTPDLGQIGMWRGGLLLTPEMAASAEKLGYGAVWIGGSPGADLMLATELLDATERITVSTGIVNIWTSPATEVAKSFHRLERSHPGRFMLGIGIGHREAQGDTYQRPFDALTSYLDVLDTEGVPVNRRLISALGPRTLKLATKRAAGTHPYLTTPIHTQFARDLIGADPIIAVEQRLIFDDDAASARDAARQFLKRYLALSNYRRTLEQHGFTAADLDDGATDESVDALVPHGSPEVLAAVVRDQLDAGANHVCVQFLPPREDPIPLLARLAKALELSA